MVNEQPEALRLAELLDTCLQLSAVHHTDAAAELRRLHAANLDCMAWYEVAKSQRDELLAALQRLSFAAMSRDNTMGDPSALRAALEQPQVEQEPVAWLREDGKLALNDGGMFSGNRKPLYTQPQPKREPLTDEAEHQCPYPKANPSTRNAWLDGWEAAERAHGIGGEA